MEKYVYIVEYYNLEVSRWEFENAFSSEAKAKKHIELEKNLYRSHPEYRNLSHINYHRELMMEYKRVMVL